MKKTIFNNLGLKIVAVFIAFLIWLMVVNGDDPEKPYYFKNITVTTINEESFLEKNKVYAVKDDSNIVTVRVKVRRSVWAKLSAEDFTVIADLSYMTFMDTIPLKVVCNNTSVSIPAENLSCEPSSLKITVENKEEKTFMVSVATSGQPATGYEVGSERVLQGESIIVEGPSSLIKIIDKVRAPVSVGAFTSNQEISIGLQVIDKNGDEFKESQMDRLTFKTTGGKVLTDAMVDVYVVIWEVQSVKLEIPQSVIGKPAAGYHIAGIELTPSTVNLAGAEETLKELNGKLKLEDVIDITDKTSTVEKSIDISEYLLEHYKKDLKLETDSPETISVKVQIEEIGTTTLNFLITDVNIIGLSDDLSLTLTPADKIPIEVRALSADAATISEKDVQVTLDLSSSTYQKEGNHNKVPLKIKLSTDDYELVNRVTIAVDLAKKQNTIEEE